MRLRGVFAGTGPLTNTPLYALFSLRTPQHNAQSFLQTLQALLPYIVGHTLHHTGVNVPFQQFDNGLVHRGFYRCHLDER